ncbi:hypothetical protein [Cupriavidus pinatubonensis]
MDFVGNSVANGRHLKCLTVADEFTDECTDIALNFHIDGNT